MWCVERIICVSFHLWDHENSQSLGIYISRLGDHIQEAPLPVGSAIAAFAICEVLDALDCLPGIFNSTGDSEFAVTGNKRHAAMDRTYQRMLEATRHKIVGGRRVSPQHWVSVTSLNL